MVTDRPEDIQYIVVDLFAGAGGTSSGVERAVYNNKKVAVVIAAVNHDLKAIETHSLNHPDAEHFIEDIRTLDMSKLMPVINRAKKLYSNAKLVLWASLECTNHSNAKGGPKEAGSRTLGLHLFRYIDAMHPDHVFIENVREFLDWGPCDDNGYPIASLKGQTFEWWRNLITFRGYDYTQTISNAADFGAYTSRTRYFGAFSKPGLFFKFPDTTHSRKGTMGMKLWKPVRDVLDLTNVGESIFRKKRSDMTYKRIYAGLLKFVPKQEDGFLTQYNGNGGNYSNEQPCRTLTTKDRFAKIHIQFMDQQYGTGTAKSLDVPASTLTTVPKLGVVTTQFLDNPQWGGNCGAIDLPCFTLIARMDKAPPSLVSAEVEMSSFSNNELDNSDMEYERKIKEFMIENRISDIKMRMLEIPEMLQIMGFGKDYQMVGTKTDQKRFIGNAVECGYTQVWFESLASYNIVSNNHVNCLYTEEIFN